MRKSILAVAVGLLAVQTRAAKLMVTYGIDAAYDNTTDFTAVPYNPTLNPATTGIVYEIPIYFQLSNLGTGEDGFGGIDITVTTSGAVSIDSNYSYYANDPTYTVGKLANPYFATNGEAGILNSHSVEIVAAISAGVTNETDPRYTMAQSSPFWLGDIYVDLGLNQGGGYVYLTVNNFATNNNGTLVNDYGSGSNNTGSLAPISTIVFLFPEPESLSLVGMGALRLMSRRRLGK